MPLYLYNSLSNTKEQFTALNEQNITMYVCGPTVYDRPHIGNIRSIVVYDVLFRILQHIYGKQQVLYVRNITDVDDKINKRALERNIAITALTDETIQMFDEDTAYLHCLKPNIEPKATEHIDVMIQIIESLLTKDIAYQDSGYVFFDISKFNKYTELSGRKIEELVAGARISVNENKRNPGDFILWKPADNDTPASAIFDSPFGKGRPGWHIECSAMSYKYLGKNFDIHGGGADLMFPHHSNEIAQSCCAFENSHFAKYWVHNGFLTYNGEKMSKSLGNIKTIEDFRNDNIPGSVLRLMLLSTHYRKPMDLNDKLLNDSQKTFDTLSDAINHSAIDVLTAEGVIEEELIEILCDDLNTPKALAYLHRLAKDIHIANKQEQNENIARKLLGACNLLGIDLAKKKRTSSLSDKNIQLLVEKRKKARSIGNWASADAARDELLNQGVILEDMPDGSTKWHFK